MHHKAIIYSLDPKIHIQNLKTQDVYEYDRDKYTKLLHWAQTHKICCMMVEEKDHDLHYKFFAIRPKVSLVYYMGNISLLNQKILGMVGPRKMSIYGKKVIETTFEYLKTHNVVTISGLAEGVDQLCHQLSLTHNIPTIAVLGGGIGRYIKRPEYYLLIQQIIEAGGLVVSEYKLFEQPTYYTFPQRNRLIAGLSDIVFLPEAGKKSGSLITVDYALAMKKPVYATPNSIFAPNSAGILSYIEKGSIKPIFHLQNFFDTHFSSKNISSRLPITIQLTDQEQGLFSLFSHNQPQDIKKLLQKTGYDIQQIIPLLTMLEIKGILYQDSPGTYVVL